MKLSTLFVGAMVVGTLAACQQVGQTKAKVEEQKATQVAATNAQPTFEVAAYLCDVKGKRNKVVSATYAFVNGEVDTATVSIDGVVVGHEMRLDKSYKDGSSFTEGHKVWSLSEGFSQNTVNKTVPVMFTSNNRILARNCEIAK